MDGMTATTPFLEFRLWWRRASTGKQSAAVGAVAAALALVIWIAVPLAGSGSSSNLNAGSNGRGFASGTGSTAAAASGGPGDTSTTTAAGPAAGPSTASSTGTAGAAGGGNGAGAAGGSGGGPGGLLATGCSGPAKTMNVGVVLVDAGGVNSVIGAPSTSQQQGMWNAVFDSINKSGGAGCNHLVPDFQTDNEFNPSSAQSACLNFIQHKDFAVLFGFLPVSPDTCLLQNHIPVFEETGLSSADVQKNYPYYFGGAESLQVIYRNWAYASRQLNVFNPANGFKKIGIFYRDCQPEVNQAMLADLQAVGVPSSAIDRADVGCPSAFASPSAIEQAVIKFKSDGVTTATIDNDLEDTQNITKQSQAQGFHPRWTVPDDGMIAVTQNPSFAPDPNNFDNTLAITPLQYGANTTPGFKESPTDVQCDQIMNSHGQPGAVASPDQFSGAVCNIAWMFAAALDHAPSVAPDQLAAGLQRVGSVPFSFPYGPNNFSAPGTTYGGQFWRPVTYHSSCGCWKVDNPNFSPSF
jgi:hypothetical protein